MILQPTVRYRLLQRSLLIPQEQPDGSRVLFTFAGKFLNRLDAQAFVFYNGQLLEEGLLSDYTLSESAGVGSGFDELRTNFTPKTDDKLRVFAFVKI